MERTARARIYRARGRAEGTQRASRDGKQLTVGGDIVTLAQRYRTQAQNRADARERLTELIRAAAHRPKPRRKTKPSAAAKRKRVESKRRQGEIKRARRNAPDF